MTAPRPPFAAVRLDELERSGTWRPVRRRLDVTAVGINAYTADDPGDEVIEPHDETSAGAGRHEEVYVVLTGRADFTIAGERLDAPAGTLVRVDVGVPREAVAAEPRTTVLVVGGRPGSALPVSPFEHWYAAQPAYEAGDYRRAIEIASQGLADWPDHPTLRYQLACYEALAGEPDRALEHLRSAFGRDARLREWAEQDADLDSLRARPDYPA